MALITDGSEIYLSGFIGDDLFGDGVTSGQVVSALAKLRDKDITLRVNSGGGVATEGAAINAALMQHKGKVKVQIEGIAASAASLIAMAGSEIEMMPGAVMMIHDPATVTFGDAKAHGKTIEALDALGDSYADIYARRIGRPASLVREMMREETWLDAEGAIELGFATSRGISGRVAEPTAFAYGLYRNAPRELVALASAHGWTPRAFLNQRKTQMTDEPKKPEWDDEPDAKPKSQEIQEKPPVKETTLNEKQEETKERTLPPETGEPGVDDVIARAEEIVALCKAGNIPSAHLLRSRATVEQAKARVAEAAAIRAALARAQKLCPDVRAQVAEDAILQGKTLKEATDLILDELADKQSAEIASPIAPEAKDQGADKETAKRSWDKVVAKQNARFDAATRRAG